MDYQPYSKPNLTSPPITPKSAPLQSSWGEDTMRNLNGFVVEKVPVLLVEEMKIWYAAKCPLSLSRTMLQIMRKLRIINLLLKF